MIDFVLNKKDLTKRDLPHGLKVGETKDSHIIMTCINLFNKDVSWGGMFDVFEAERRIKDGQKMFVASIDDEIFGYCWLEELNPQEFYIYNAFSKKTDYLKRYGAIDIVHYIIKNYTRGIIKLKVDVWNTKSLKIIKKLGFSPC